MMKKLLLTIFPLLAVVLSGCAETSPTNEAPGEAPTAQSGYQKISAEEATRLMDEHDDYILLDVRTEEEYAESRIDGAILLPDHELAERAAEVLPNKDAPILVYCRSGRRSASAAKALIDMGYSNIYDLGGIIDWPYETVSG